MAPQAIPKVETGSLALWDPSTCFSPFHQDLVSSAWDAVDLFAAEIWETNVQRGVLIAVKELVPYLHHHHPTPSHPSGSWIPWTPDVWPGHPFHHPRHEAFFVDYSTSRP